MLFKNHENSTVILTTPDYPPKLGGLSTYSKSIESALRNLGINFDIFVWDSLNELKNFSAGHKYKVALHIHFFGHHYLKSRAQKHVNFIHGSEILFTSPNILKRYYKKLIKPLYLQTLKKSHCNVFISNFTFEKLQEKGLKPAYDRDLIFHNCINTEGSRYKLSDLEENTLRLVCLARDVPHKNLDSLLDLAKATSLATKKTVELFAPREIPSSSLVKTTNISAIGDNDRDELLANCHFNLLLSLDHSSRGFYEGFGLTVLEAGKFGTPSIVSPYGGLPEAVHHNHTGWVIAPDKESFYQFFSKLNKEEYKRVSEGVFDHTLRSHNQNLYEDLIKKVLGES